MMFRKGTMTIMNQKWDPQGPIRCPELDRRLIEVWASKAGHASNVERFVFSFIVLNHYYSAWAIHHPPRKHTDRAEMVNLSTLLTVQDSWKKVLKHLSSNPPKIQLPLKNLRGRDVPAGLAPGAYEPARLSLENCLEVLYQLRCDLFHARAGAAAYRNESAVRFASLVAYEIVGVLVGMTTA